MDPPVLQRFGKVFFATALAVTLAVPAPTAACCRGAKVPTCCHAATAATSNCCSSTTKVATCNCVCSRPADERNLPPSRNSDHSQPDLTLAFGSVAAILYNPDATAKPDSDQTALLGGVSAIPHRILHCTWLI